MPRLSRTVVLALLAAQLGGCVAATLVPVAAGGAAGQINKLTKRRSQNADPQVIVGPAAAPQEAAPPNPEPDQAAAPFMEVAKDILVETPVRNPSSVFPTARLAQDDAGYVAMTAFVIAAMGDGKPVAGRKSMLIEQRSLATLPRMQACADRRNALIIDLDRGDQPFNLNDAPTPEPGLAEQLRTIRGRGVAVVWVATLPQSAERDVLTMIKATGLDPLGLDHALLLQPAETRKQQILNRAGEEWCALAVAGDSRSDFDEVFDYLRNPDGPVALALEQYIGAGWFLVPPPIR